MKIVNQSGRGVVLALAFGVACASNACGGDDTGTPASTGGRSGASGSTGGSSGQGGTAGRDSSAGTGGTGGTAGTGGASGAGGVRLDAGPDVRADASTGGAGGTPASDASDVTVRNDASDATVRNDASDATVRNDATDAPVGSDATDVTTVSDVTDAGGDGRVCPRTAGPDGSVAFQLYSFDVVGGVATGVGDWSTYSPGEITTSVDDYAGDSAAAPGSIHAHMGFPFGPNSNPVIERGYFGNPQDFSCFTRAHWWIKITSPVGRIQSINPYVGTVFGPFTGDTNLAAISDGNWHELITPLTGDLTAIMKIGVEVRAPADFDGGVDAGPDGGPALPPADVFIDNVWLE